MLDFDDLEAETLRLFRLYPETALKYAKDINVFLWMSIRTQTRSSQRY
jgi:hypothetical protein